MQVLPTTLENKEIFWTKQSLIYWFLRVHASFWNLTGASAPVLWTPVNYNPKDYEHSQRTVSSWEDALHSNHWSVDLLISQRDGRLWSDAHWRQGICIQHDKARSAIPRARNTHCRGLNIARNRGRDEIDAVLQTTISNAFSWMKMFEFRLNFHWSLFLRAQLIIFQHWFR